MEGVWASEVSLSLPPSLYPNTVFHPAVALDSECLFSVFNFFSSPSFLPSFRDCGWIVGGLWREGFWWLVCHNIMYHTKNNRWGGNDRRWGFYLSSGATKTTTERVYIIERKFLGKVEKTGSKE